MPKTKITAKEKARTKKKVGLAVYFTFIATFALCFGAQLWMIDAFNTNDGANLPNTYSTDTHKSDNTKRQFATENNYPLENKRNTQTENPTTNDSRTDENETTYSAYSNNENYNYNTNIDSYRQ